MPPRGSHRFVDCQPLVRRRRVLGPDRGRQEVCQGWGLLREAVEDLQVRVRRVHVGTVGMQEGFQQHLLQVPAL